MINAKIINASVDDDFRIKAFADYCEAKQRKYSELIAMISEVVDEVPVVENEDQETEVIDQLHANQRKYSSFIATRNLNTIPSALKKSTSRDTIELEIPEPIQRVLDAHPDIASQQYLMLDEGYVRLDELLTAVYNDFNAEVNDLTSDVNSYSKTIELQTADGVKTVNISAQEAIENVKVNLHAATAVCAANAAVLCDTLSDKITVFNDKINTLFQNGYNDISNTANFLKELISKATSPIEYLKSFLASSKAEELAEDNSDLMPKESEIYDITGSNPLAGLSLLNPFQIVGTAINAGAKLIAGVAVSAWNAIKGWFVRTSDKLYQTIIDPYDIEKISNSSCYTVDGWCYGRTNTYTLSKSVFRFDITDEQFAQIAPSIAQSMDGKVYKFSNIFGEFLIQITSSTWDADNNYIISSQKTCFKPKPITVDVYSRMLNAFGIKENYEQYITTNDGNIVIDNIVNALNEIKTWNTIYCDVDTTEIDLWQGFARGYYIGNLLMSYCMAELDNPIYIPHMTSVPCPKANYFWNSLNTPTNLDFVSICSGWDPVNSVFHSYYSPQYGEYLLLQNGAVISIIANVEMDDILNGIEATFVPYRKSKEGFTESRFSIKTDSQNQTAAQQLFTAIIIVLLIVAVGITVKIVTTKISRAIYMKRLQAKSQLDAKMWASPPVPLSAWEKRRYVKLERKLGAAASVSSGLQSVASNIYEQVKANDSPMNSEITVSDIDKVIKILR